MDGVIADYEQSFKQAKTDIPENAYPQSAYGFFASLKPISGSIESVNELRNDPRFDVHILTAPSVKNPMCYLEKRVWIEKYFDLEFCDNLIIAKNKSLLLGDILIDDNSHGRGQDKFNGKLIVFGGEEFPNWLAIMKRLVSISFDSPTFS